MKGEFYYKNIDLHIHAVFLLVWIMCLYSSYFSDIIVRSSFVKYATLLPVHLSKSVIGHMQ